MQILSAKQIKEWDAFTIANEPVAPIDLMERAAQKCVEWILRKNFLQKSFSVFCGKGNNGGDGLAIARLLLQRQLNVVVYILENGKQGTSDFQNNLQRLRELHADIHFIEDLTHFPLLSDCVVIDALFGIGLNKPLVGDAALLVQHINQQGAFVVSIDLPSGMSADESSVQNPVIKAAETTTFQCYKPALLMAENAVYFGSVTVLNIGLNAGFLKQQHAQILFSDAALNKAIYQPRKPFAHKGTYGHALIIAGSFGKMGAAILAVKACVHSGAGLTTAFIPDCGYNIMQLAVPEAMALVDANENSITNLPAEMEKYSAIGIGPGIGTGEATQKMIAFICRRYQKPFVIDADALNCLALNKALLAALPAYSVLTPHPKEFDRLFGEQANDFERMQAAVNFAAQYNIIIVLKGHRTLITTPGGVRYFNASGNAGMAKGGSGDVLTGIITSLLAQGYSPIHAVLFGVYLHGAAGDVAAAALSQEAMTPGDIINSLSTVFLQQNSA